MLPAVHTTRAAMREEMRLRIEAAARAAAPDVLEFVACTRTRTRDLDEDRLRELLGAGAGTAVEFTTLDTFLQHLAPVASADALRRLRRIVQANLVDVKVAVAGDRACVVGGSAAGGIAGLSAQIRVDAGLPDRA